jgi:hypothetical protein
VNSHRVTYVVGNDWEGLYVDGEIVNQGHTLRLQDLAEALKIDLHTVEPDDEWLGKVGHLPQKLSKVKFVRRKK